MKGIETRNSVKKAKKAVTEKRPLPRNEGD